MISRPPDFRCFPGVTLVLSASLFVTERASPQTSPVKNAKSQNPGKRTQFTLPNQTTWQVTAQKKADGVGVDSNKMTSSQGTPQEAPLSSELVDIR